MEIGSGIQKLIGGYADSMQIAQAYFHFFKIRKVGKRKTSFHPLLLVNVPPKRRAFSELYDVTTQTTTLLRLSLSKNITNRVRVWGSALQDVSGQLHAPAALTPRKLPQDTHLTGGCVGPRAGLDADEKNLAPAGNQTLAGQHVARRYTD
jgi:hypothetical protein